ncbi:MAG TPA: cystathionine gamma-synthase [Steroidobacteraceae bacterium]|jgi:cystathionine gamma-synthase|nr:cystathionine gamma-synthase [Steroidobacteraceae bacterium]
MSSSPPKNKRAIATRSVRAGLESDAQHGSVVPPIYLSTNFAFERYRKPRKYDYTRSGNPTRDQLAGALADLEGGAGAVVTCTGLSAITLILATLPSRARVIAPYDCYGGTYRLLAALHAQGNLVVDFVDQGDAAALAAALAKGAHLVWIETPSNPLLRVVDIRAIADAARAAGALSVVDNTFLSPIWQQPLALGADMVMHSTTKYLNGHSDVVGGAVIAATAELQENLAWWANAIGVTGAPFDSFMTLRGVRTLHARMRVHAENTAVVVDFLAAQPAVERVYYPGLADHPGHEIARRQQSGFGAMLSFELAGGEPAVEAFLTGLQCFTLAESLGGVESLISHPATMTHAGMEEAARLRAGIGAGLLRVSVGIEEASDLVADLAAGLERAARVQPAPHLRRHAS